LFLDEPSVGLSPILVGQIFKLLKKISRAETTILLVEQHAAIALKKPARGYVLQTAPVLLHGKTGRLVSNAKVRQAYLGRPIDTPANDRPKTFRQIGD
jgi:branched-chain amino acid transport system ATP-binding protein